MIDAYDKLFEKYEREKFFNDSIEEIIYVSFEKIEAQWENQKHLLINNGVLFIRGYGRDAKQTYLFFKLYENLFQNSNIKKDSTNNANPTKLLSQLTPYSKIADNENSDGKERIQNYQITHLFARTKNPLLFTAAWNFAYIPKYLDPFTGHESQGVHCKVFKLIFEKILRDKFSLYIDDYNKFLRLHVNNKLEEALEKTRKDLRITKKDFKRFKDDAESELSEI